MNFSPIRNSLRKNAEVIAASILLFSFVFIEFYNSNFGILHNDFVGLLNLGQLADFNDLATFHNGFFPAYSILLYKLISLVSTGLNVMIVSAIINILALAGIWITLLQWIRKEFRNLTYQPFFALLVLISFNKFFVFTVVQGPYLIFAFLLCRALFLLSIQNLKTKHLVFIGLLIATAASIRFHGLIMLLFVFALSVARFISLKELLVIVAVFAIGSIPNSIVSISNGQFPFSSSQTISIANIEWENLNPYTEQPSMVDVFLNEPFIFISQYFSRLKGRFLFLIVSIITLCSTLIYRNSYSIKILSFFSIFYILFVSIHPSHRGLIPVYFLSPIGVLFIANNFNQVFKRFKFLKTINISALIALLCFLIFRTNYPSQSTKQAALQVDQNRKIEKVLKAKQIEVTEVFTNSAFFYFPNDLPELPLTKGGWPKMSPTFYEHRPNLNTHQIDSFLLDCKKNEIKAVVIKKQGKYNRNFNIINTSQPKIELCYHDSFFNVYLVQLDDYSNPN